MISHQKATELARLLENHLTEYNPKLLTNPIGGEVYSAESQLVLYLAKKVEGLEQRIKELEA